MTKSRSTRSPNLLSIGPAKLAAKVAPDLQRAWLDRAQTYVEVGTVLDPRAVHAFTTRFTKLDARPPA